MNRRNLPACLIAGALGACLLGCQRTATPDQEVPAWRLSRETGPVLVRQGPPNLMEQEFVLPNPSSTEEMVLELKTRNCHCVDYSFSAERVPPGGEVRVVLRAVASTVPGRKDLRAVFTTGLRTRPLLELHWTLDTRPTLELVPPSLPVAVLHGREAGELRFDVIARTLAGTSDPPISLECDSKVAEASIEDTVVETDGNVRSQIVRCRVRILASENVGVRRPEGEALVRVRHGAEVMGHEVRWLRRWPVGALPTSLFFQAGAGDQQKVVRLRGDAPFAIKKLRGLPEYLEVDCTPNTEAKEHDLTVRCRTNHHGEAASSATLVIEVSHPRQADVEVPIYVLW
jgi:hypothetical protein